MASRDNVTGIRLATVELAQTQVTHRDPSFSSRSHGEQWQVMQAHICAVSISPMIVELAKTISSYEKKH